MQPPLIAPGERLAAGSDKRRLYSQATIAFDECNANFVLVALCLTCRKLWDFLVFGLPFGRPFCFIQGLTFAENLRTRLHNL